MQPIKSALIALLLVSFAGCVAYSPGPRYGPPPSQPPGSYEARGYEPAPAPRVSVGFFYDELSPYGDWLWTVDFGWVWFPRDVAPYWHPYLEGRWVVTEYGWTWASYEPFGWATYHYGRWAWDHRYGWLWVPGTVWGPAWVSWQVGAGYVGWAPLPPAVGFEVGVGLHLGNFNLSVGIRPDAYCFVPERWFLAPRLSSYRIPTARNVTIIHNTTNITQYTYVDNRVFNRGVEVRDIEQATGERVARHRVVETRERTRTEVGPDEVRIYRPERQQLETVRVAPGPSPRTTPEAGPRDAPRATPRADTGTRHETPSDDRNREQPTTSRREAPAPVVAPRVDRNRETDARTQAEKERREKQELEKYQAEEARRIEALHREERANTPANTDREQVRKTQAAEREALKEQQRTSEQQLEERQKVRREAAQAKPPSRASARAEEKAVEEKKTDGKQQGSEKKATAKEKENQKDTKRKKGKG